MLMLQRAAENVNPSECNDPAVLLACSLGSDSCPAACQKKADEDSNEPTPSNIQDMPVAGDLTVAVADYSSEIRSVPAVATVVMNAVDFKASEKITIESIKLERTGLSDKSAIKWVWFEKDGVAVSAKASLNTDGVATTRFYNNFSVNGTETLDLVAELSGSAGSEIAFKITDVVSTAKNVSANAQTSTVRTTSYNVAKIGFKISGTNSVLEYKVGEQKSFEIGRFELNNEKGGNEDKSIIVKSLKLKNASGLNLGDTFKNVYVTRDSKTVSKSVTLDSKEMTIVFDDNEIESGKKAIYTIYAEVAQLNEVNEAVQLELKKTTELVANEKGTNFRVAYTSSTKNNTLLRVYKFKGGKVTFTNDSSLTKTVEAAAGSSDVVIAKGKLTISEPVKLEGLKLVASADTADKVKNHIKDLKIEFNGSTYSANTTPDCDGAKCTYTFEDDIYVSKTSDVRVLVNLKGDDTHVDTITFENLNGQSFTKWTYENSDEGFTPSEAIAGTVQISKLTVKAGKFNITNKNSTTQKVVINNSDEVVIFDWEITAKSGKVNVNDLVLTGTNSRNLGNNEQITLSLSVNGNPFNDIVYKGTDTTARFSNLGEVESGTPMKIKITAQWNISSVYTVTYSVGAEGSDENGNDVVATPTTSSTFEVTWAASATVATSSASSTVILDGTNTELATFNVTIKDGTYDLTGVKLTLNSSAPAWLIGQSLTLEIDWQSVGSQVYNWGDLIIAGLNESLAVGRHTFTVKANANVKNSGSVLVDIDSVILNNQASTEKVLNVKKLITKAYPVISATTNDTDLTLTIRNPHNNNEDFEIVGFDVTGTGTYVSFNNTNIDLTSADSINDQIKSKHVSLWYNDEVKLVISAGYRSTIQVNAITVSVNGKEFKINSDYTNVGTWSTFKVSAGDKGSNWGKQWGSVTPAAGSVTVSDINVSTAWASTKFVTTVTAKITNSTNASATITSDKCPTLSEEVLADWSKTVTCTFDYVSDETFNFKNGSTALLAPVNVPAVTIAVEPANASVAVGATTNLTVTKAWATSYPDVVWTTSDGTKATVDDGVVTWVAAGSAVITATLGATTIKDTSTVTVTAAP